MADTNSDDRQSFVARLPHSFLSFIGATAVSEFGAKFSDWCSGIIDRLTKLESKTTPPVFDPAPFTARIEAMEAKLKDAPTKENVESWAKTAGSTEAVKAVAGIGLNPAAITPASPTVTTTTATAAADALIAQGKYEEAFASLPLDHKDRKDFASAQRYAAYMRALNSGSIAIYQQEKK